MVSCVGFMFAGVTACWAVLALFSRSLCLIVGALILATPMNLFFYSSVRSTKRDVHDEGGYGLGRTGWLLAAWSAYGLGAGGALWAVMGW